MKDQWRSEMKRRLERLNRDSAMDDANIRIGTVISELTSARPGLWLAFSSTRHEPLIPAVSEKRAASEIRYAFPRMVADPHAKDAASKMNFYVWTDSSTPAVWSEHRFGMREPDVTNASWRQVDVERDSICGALIPGLGFDRHLHRLGRGAGFYDRFLTKNLKKNRYLKVGVGFAVQLADELPHEAHDVQLDALVTDREVIWKVDVS